jgi:hypothetical protein
MATNLLAEVTKVLSPTIVSRIASGLGITDASTQKAIAAAVPTILGALIAFVSKPQGATKLNDVVAKQEPGMLSSLASVVGESGQKALIDQGAGLLTSLFGGKDASTFNNAVAQYAGIGEGASKNLMGLLGPVVLGVLGQQQRKSGLDAAGLANLLTSQKDAVAAALPSGYSKYLTDTGILGGVTKPVAKQAQQEASSGFPWGLLLTVLALLAIGALLWRMLSGTPQDAVETTSPAAVEAPYAGVFAGLRGVTEGGVDIGNVATSAINSLHTSLESINNVATAESALPKLTDSSSQFDQLTGILNQLSPETRKTLAETIAGIRPNIDQLIDKALAIPGVGDVIKPVVDTIRAKLDQLAAA